MAGGVGGVGLEVAEDELSSSGLMFRNEVELIIHLGLPEILEEVPGLSSIGGKTRLLMVVQKSSQICQSKSCS